MTHSPSKGKRTTKNCCITLPVITMNILEKLLTPKGYPKGKILNLSSVIAKLLENFIMDSVPGASDIYEIYEAIEDAPERTKADLLSYFKAREAKEGTDGL